MGYFRRALLLAAMVLAPAAPCTCVGPAHAQDGDRSSFPNDRNDGAGLAMDDATLSFPTRSVSPGLLCSVQATIRWRAPPWTTRECARVAQALSATPNPRLLAAICLNESDWRPQVVARVSEGVYDVGLCGVRCRLGDDGLCTNGPARGYTLKQLQDPLANIRVAAAVLDEKGGSLGRFNGATTQHRRARYADRISALVAALGGVEVKVQGKRLRKLVRQIVGAVTGEPRT